MDTNVNPRENPSMEARIVWVFFSFVMWAWAIIGPLAVFIGSLSFSTNLVSFEGATNQQKLGYMGMAAVLGLVGISFAWLRCAGFLRFGDEAS